MPAHGREGSCLSQPRSDEACQESQCDGKGARQRGTGYKEQKAGGQAGFSTRSCVPWAPAAEAGSHRSATCRTRRPTCWLQMCSTASADNWGEPWGRLKQEVHFGIGELARRCAEGLQRVSKLIAGCRTLLRSYEPGKLPA